MANLSGSVSIKGVPQSGVTVLLYDEATYAFVASTTTDGAGLYTFTGLSTANTYFMVYKEPSGLWEYRVSSRRTPV